MTNVLVTGGGGFIGSNLVDRLLSEGHQVTVVDDLSTGKLHNLQQARRNPDYTLAFHRLDITSDALHHVVEKATPEVILHLAAQIDVRRSVENPVRDGLVNVIGTVQLLEAARRYGVRKVVLTTSGGCIYGEPAPDELPVAEDYPGSPHSPYGASKLAAETYLQMYHNLYGLEWTSLALGNVYGPRQDPLGEAGVVSIFTGAMLAGQETMIYGDGQQTRDFVFVDDVVHAFVLAMTRGHGQRYNIGTGEQTSVKDLFDLVAQVAGYSGSPRYAPERTGELRHIALDCRRAATDLGWKPWTTLKEGLEATVDWIRT